MLYERNDIAFTRGNSGCAGTSSRCIPAYLENEAIRVEFFGDEIERISVIDPLDRHGAKVPARRTRSIRPSSS